MDTMSVIWSRARQISAANPDLAYTLLAIAMTIGAVATIPERSSDPEVFKDPDGLSTALVVVQTAVLAFLRRWPVGVLTVLAAALVTEAGLGYELGDAAFLSSLIVMFLVGSRVSGNRLVFGIAVNAGVLIVLFFLEGGGIETIGDLLINLVIFGGAWAGGIFVGSRVTRIAQVESYAAELSAQRDLAAREAAEEERARIARDLHDAVGHTLNLIVVQAGAAQRVREHNPAAAYEALQSIESTGRQALADMDRMLGILREQSDGQAAPELGPRPGLARLGAMLAEARSAGLSVEVEISGEERRLPVSIDLTAYRIVQEAITNVMKHAPGADTKVRIDYAPRVLKLEIRNGPPRQPVTPGRRSGGRGLPGMQERVVLFGGSMEPVALQGGGFLVKVSLPLDGAS
jgi:signal transduction histidine kinase